MKRVTGIGGIFFKAKDAPSLQAWYTRRLGIDVQVWGGAALLGPTPRASRLQAQLPGQSIRKKVITLLRVLRPSWSTTEWQTSTPWSKP